MGRPTKLTPQVHDAIVKAVRGGNYPEVAAQCAGIDRATYFRWMQYGESTDESHAIYRDFRDAVTRARAWAERKMVRVIRTAAITDARAAEWYLERSASDRWGRRDKLTIESAVNAELDAMLGKLEAGLTPDEYERVLSVLSGRDAGAEAPGVAGDGAGATH